MRDGDRGSEGFGEVAAADRARKSAGKSAKPRHRSAEEKVWMARERIATEETVAPVARRYFSATCSTRWRPRPQPRQSRSPAGGLAAGWSG